MPKTKLQPGNLRTLKVLGGRTDWRDTEQPGLVLRVSGTEPRERVFYFEYSFKNRSRRYRLGDLTEAKTLADRRREVRVLRGRVSEGVDVVAERQQADPSHAGETFGQLGERALAALEKTLRPKTIVEWRRMFAREILPAMGNVPAADPTSVKVAALELVDRIAERAPYGANRVLELCRRIMSYAVAADRRGIYAANPLLRVAKPLREETVRTRVYSADEVRAIVAACAGTPLEDVVPLLLATGARAGETLAAEWTEFELPSATWHIPADHAKIRHDRPVPLSGVALAVLANIREKVPNGLLFPARSRSGHQERKQKLIYLVRRRSGVADFELHDLRRVVRAGLADLGVATDVGELCLGHLPPKLVRRYAPHPTFWRLNEQRAAMAAWGARLAEILTGVERRAQVVPLVRA